MTSFKLGRLPAQIPAALHDLTYYTAGPLPKPPAKVAVPAIPAQPDGTPWGLDGNSDYGDCGVAGLNHLLRAIAADTAEHEKFPTAKQVVSYYLAYTGGQDSGVVLSDFLAHVKQDRFYGHTLAAYAPVSVSDINTLRFAINAYGAYVGISVTEGMMAAVQGDGPWTWTLDDISGDVVGGHCVPLLGFDSNWLLAVTWGQVIRIAYPAWHQIAAEAWALLVGEEVRAKADGHGLSLAALQADLNRLSR